MLKIKWNMIPKEFIIGRVAETPDLHIRVYKGRTSGGYRVLVEEEYVTQDLIATDVSTREDWEREQWKSAPDWAMYYAVDSDGDANWYARETILHGHHAEWVKPYDDTCDSASVIFQYGEDWTKSLRKRPEPICSKEEAERLSFPNSLNKKPFNVSSEAISSVLDNTSTDYRDRLDRMVAALHIPHPLISADRAVEVAMDQLYAIDIALKKRPNGLTEDDPREQPLHQY